MLVHICCAVSPGGAWHRLKREIIDALYTGREGKILGVLDAAYADTEAIFLQEASTAFASTLRRSPLGRSYVVVAPAAPSRSGQNSFVLLRRTAFDAASVAECTEEVVARLGADAPVAAGDLLALTATHADGSAFVLASFHGDSAGLATVPVLAALRAHAASLRGHALLVGCDANSAEKGKPGKTLGAAELSAALVEQELASCFGDAAPAAAYTTCQARTFLQPQLQKAARALDAPAPSGTRNPKDLIIFSRGLLAATSATRDNTGRRTYADDMLFPTLDFPSDHAIVAATLARRHA